LQEIIITVGIIIGIVLFVSTFYIAWLLGDRDKDDIVGSICFGIIYMVAFICVMLFLLCFIGLGLQINKYL
jgi:hypothetical protein